MALSGTHQKKTLLQFGLLLVAFMIIGCAGFEPYEPRDDREEGPKSGLFSGAEGEFVIIRKAGAPGTGKEEKKAEVENGEQQP